MDQRFAKIVRDLGHVAHELDIMGGGPDLLSGIVTPTVHAIGSRPWIKMGVRCLVGAATVARVEDAGGPAAPGAVRTSPEFQGQVSMDGELWYVVGGYMIHSAAAGKNLALGVSKMIADTKWDVEIFQALNATGHNPYVFPRPFVLDWNSHLYVSANGAREDAVGLESPAALGAGEALFMRCFVVPLQVGEEIYPEI